MCEHWKEVTNNRLLATALMVAGNVASPVWAGGNAIKLWEIRSGAYAWTFSFHPIGKPTEVEYHWHSSLVYYNSEVEAVEAMVNFVNGLNMGMRKAK